MFILCIIIFIIIAVLFFIIPNHFVNKIFIKTNKKLFERKEKDKKETEEQKQIKENRRKWFENSQKDIYTISSDNMKLHAHIIENDKSNYGQYGTGNYRHLYNIVVCRNMYVSLRIC